MEPLLLTHPLTELLTEESTGISPATISHAAQGATVVGLGVNTRESREIFELVAETTYALIEKGFTTLAIQDTHRVAQLLDQYIDDAEIDITAALAQAWGPWQTVEMCTAMQRLREHNRQRAGSGDRVRIIGLTDPRAVLADYDRVVELLTELDAQTAAEVEDYFATIRIAHSGGEHVERAHGTHPGTAFVDLARAAQDITAGLPESPQRQEALHLLALIVDYHADALGEGFDRAREERRATERILEHHRQTGARIVIWDGFAHIAAHPSDMYGSLLRQVLGQKYWAAHIFFGQGDIGRAVIPAPMAGTLDAAFAAQPGERTVNLRDPQPPELTEQLNQPQLLRLVSGMYDPARDAEHYAEVPSVTASFDLLAYLPTITPTQGLER